MEQTPAPADEKSKSPENRMPTLSVLPDKTQIQLPNIINKKKTKTPFLKKTPILICFLSKKNTVVNIRKNMFLGFGIGIFLFGFFLRYVLHVILTQPLISMLETAKGFTIGKELLRFNESRQDEFGYLGRFINNALESVLEKQELLVMALERASA